MKSAHPQRLPARPGLFRLRCAGIADPIEPIEGPAEILVELGEPEPGPISRPHLRSIRVVATAPGRTLEDHPGAAHATALDLGDLVLLPGLVNAHTHLDLSHLGPQPHDPCEGFVAWVDRIRAGRAQEPAAIRASVERGIGLALAAGTVLVGDIAGAPRGCPSLEPLEKLGASALRGVSFLEFFAIGTGENSGLEAIERAVDEAREESASVRLGLQPHAPNTVSLRAYRWAAATAKRRGLPLATHLAETPEEREFVARARGPQRALLERLGVWRDSMLEEIGLGRTPLEHLEPMLSEARFVLAHVNDLGERPGRAIETLAACHASVAYCPRASAYFDAAGHFGPHGYRDMLEAGVNVCLGTDSLVNLPQGCDLPDGPGLSVLDEARFLFRRDGTDALTLLGMATVRGARALGFDEARMRLSPGAEPFGIVGVPISGTSPGLSALNRVLSSDSPARFLCIGK